MKRVPLFLLAAAALALVGAVWFGVRYYRRAPADSARLAALESENRELRARSEQLTREIGLLRQGLPAPPAAASHPAEHGAMPSSDAGRALEQTRQLIQFRDKLVAANASIEALQTHTQELQAQIDQATQDNQRLAASEADLKERLADANRVLEAVRNELNGKTGRLALLEEANARLREQNRQNGDKTAQALKLVRDLEDLNRRRETYLNNILRRYRELTDQYRGLAARLESSDSSPELGSIQNTISMAEEDLRQLSSLNAQAGRLQQKMAGR